MSKRNGADPPRFTPREILEGMTGILTHLDHVRFRIMSDAPDSVTDDQILEAMHKARLAHPGINRVLKANSRVWLGARGKRT